MRTYNYIDQSSWIQDFYNQLDFDTKKGFLVEIGVGNVIDYPDRDKYQREGIEFMPETYMRGPSNTAELLDIGWSGLYIDPIKEYLNQARILHKNNLDRLALVNCGASDKNEELMVGDYECLISDAHVLTDTCYYRRIVSCYYTNDILRKYCPEKIDLFSLDVEGMEDRVLKTIDYDRFKFNMIIVEINRVHHTIISSILPQYYTMKKMDGLNAV